MEDISMKRKNKNPKTQKVKNTTEHQMKKYQIEAKSKN